MAEKLKGKWLINPEGSFKFTWDILQNLFLAYVLFVTPFKFSFISDKENEFWNYVENTVDFFFFSDLVLTFFTPIYKNDKLVTSKGTIACEYLKFWFWIDIISVFPFDFIFSHAGGYTILLKLAKIPRLWKILKVAKIFRVFRLNRKNKKSTFLKRLFEKIIDFLNDHLFFLVKFMPMYIVSFGVAHILACMWHFLSRNANNPKSWVVRYGYIDSSTADKYWASLYYTYTTATTTGYGDIVPEDTDEFYLTIIMNFAGVIFYSYLFNYIIYQIDKEKEKMDDIFNKK